MPPVMREKRVAVSEFDMLDPSYGGAIYTVRLTGERLVQAGRWIRPGASVYVMGRVQMRGDGCGNTSYRIMAVDVHHAAPVWDGEGVLHGALVALTPMWIKLRDENGAIGVRIGNLGVWDQIHPFRHLLQRGEAVSVKMGATNHAEWTDAGLSVTIRHDEYDSSPRIMNSFEGVGHMKYAPNLFTSDGSTIATAIVEWYSSVDKSRAVVTGRGEQAVRMRTMAAGDTVFVEGHFGRIAPDAHGDRTGIGARHITNDMTDPAVGTFLSRVTSWERVSKGAIKLRNRIHELGVAACDSN